MHQRYHLGDRLRHLASEQADVLTTAQLLAGGVPPNALTRLSSDWWRLAPGLYCLSEPRWESLAWAGVLRGGERAVLGTAAAGFLWGVVRDAPLDLTVWVPSVGRRTPFAAGGWRVSYRQADRVGVGHLPRTRLARTLCDLANVADEDATVAAVAAAFAQRKIAPGQLGGQVAKMPRVRHRAMLLALCDSAASGIESALEWRFDQAVLRRHGLPAGERQCRTAGARVDLWYQGWAVIVELDGKRDHQHWSKDMFRDNEHAMRLGTVTLRYGWGAVCHQPCHVARQVAEVLNQRGWQGTRRLCSQCGPTQAINK